MACTLEHMLNERGHYTVLLDGDNIRHGLNKDLGFRCGAAGSCLLRVPSLVLHGLRPPPGCLGTAGKGAFMFKEQLLPASHHIALHSNGSSGSHRPAPSLSAAPACRCCQPNPTLPHLTSWCCSAEDRAENIRRIGEMAKVLADNGVITLVSSLCSEVRAGRLSLQLPTCSRGGAPCAGGCACGCRAGPARARQGTWWLNTPSIPLVSNPHPCLPCPCRRPSSPPTARTASACGSAWAWAASW